MILVPIIYFLLNVICIFLFMISTVLCRIYVVVNYNGRVIVVGA